MIFSRSISVIFSRSGKLVKPINRSDRGEDEVMSCNTNDLINALYRPNRNF